jgi:hypothetical protein
MKIYYNITIITNTSDFLYFAKIVLFFLYIYLYIYINYVK